MIQFVLMINLAVCHCSPTPHTQGSFSNQQHTEQITITSKTELLKKHTRSETEIADEPAETQSVTQTKAGKYTERKRERTDFDAYTLVVQWIVGQVNGVYDWCWVFWQGSCHFLWEISKWQKESQLKRNRNKKHHIQGQRWKTTSEIRQGNKTGYGTKVKWQWQNKKGTFR